MTNKETVQALVDALQEIATALPKDQSTVKTCYAIHNGHRDMVHAALLAGQQLLAQEREKQEPVAIRYKLQGDMNWQYTENPNQPTPPCVIQRLYAAPAPKETV